MGSLWISEVYPLYFLITFLFLSLSPPLDMLEGVTGRADYCTAFGLGLSL